MRTQTRMFSRSIAGRRDTENVIVASEYMIGEVVRKLSRKTRRLQVVKQTTSRKTVGFSCLDWTRCVTTATRKEADISSSCPPQFCTATTTRPTPGTIPFRAADGATITCYGETTIRLQRQGTSIDVKFRVADVHRSIIAVRDFAALCCEVEFPQNGAHVLTGGRRLKLEKGRERFFLTVVSIRDVSKTWFHDEIASLEVSWIPEAETGALLPADHDEKKHEPDLPIELRALRVKRRPRDFTHDEDIQHEPLHLPFRNGCPICIAARGADDPHRRRGEADRSDPQVQLDFVFLSGNKHG